MSLFRLRIVTLAAMVLWSSVALAERYTLPLFVMPATAGAPQGLLRIFNVSEESGSVEIHAIDDAGARHGPAIFTLNALAAVEFDAADLASGNTMKGLSGGLGTLAGDVRLEIETGLQIVPSAYVRAADGTLNAMHDTVRAGVAAGGGSGYRYRVPIFNAAAEVTQASLLRLINPGDEPAAITIEGRDDTGAAAAGGSVQFTLPGGGARTLTAQQLEAGETGEAGGTDQTALTGRLGAGVGRWRLSVSSDRLIQVVNVVSASVGYLVNLSTTAVVGAAPADHDAFNERFSAAAIAFRSRDDQFTFTLPATDRFTERGETEGSATSRGGSYRYESIRADAGLVTLLYDDGDVCRTNLYFESPTDGRFASRCTGMDNPGGFWSGGSWSIGEGDVSTPEEPAGTAPEGDCHPGLLVGIGASCTYPGTNDAFSVNARGRGRFLDNLAGIRIRIENETVGGRVYDFLASHEGDGVWRIERVAGMTEMPSFGAAAAPDDQSYTVGAAIDPLTLPEASGGNGTLRYDLSPEVPGLSFDPGTRQLTGTPTTAGVYDMAYTVTDADGDTDSLGFTITVEGGDDDGDTGGGTDGSTGSSGAVSFGDDFKCDATRVDPTSVRVDITGTVTAHEQLFGVRVLGYANDQFVSQDFLGDMPAGGTRSFTISGIVTTTDNRITCTVRAFFSR